MSRSPYTDAPCGAMGGVALVHPVTITRTLSQSRLPGINYYIKILDADSGLTLVRTSAEATT